MKQLLTLLMFLWVFSITAPAQQTIDASGLIGTIVDPQGNPLNGQLTLALNLANVKNVCTPPPYLTAPRGPITLNIVNGQIVNGSTLKIITQDCMKPRSAYYVSLYDSNHKLLFADNWYLHQQQINNMVRAQDVGAMVSQGFGGPVQVAIGQGVVTNPQGDQSIIQPAGTNLIINSAICTGTCIGFGGGGGSGSGSVSSVGITLPSIFNVTVSPITGAGNLVATLSTETPGTVFAGPLVGTSPTTPGFRFLASSDIPNNAANTTGTSSNVTGIVAIANGGTGTSAPLVTGAGGIQVTGSWPNITITGTSVSSGTPTQIGVYGGGGVISGDPNITDSGSLITLATAIYLPGQTANLCLATDSSQHLTTTSCGGGSSGIVSSATAGQMTYYAANGTTVVGDPLLTDTSGASQQLNYTGNGGILASGNIQTLGSLGGVNLYVGNIFSGTLLVSGGEVVGVLQNGVPGSAIVINQAGGGALALQVNGGLGLTGAIEANGSFGSAGQCLISGGGSGAVATIWSSSCGSGGGGGSGTVTLVGMTVPSGFTVSGSPISTSGTLAVGLSSETASFALIAPSGSSGTPTWRALVAADIPTLNQSTTGTASNLFGTPLLPTGTTAATQAPGTNNTTVATTAYVTAAVAAGGGGGGTWTSLAGGTNNSAAAFVVGSTSSMTFSGSGTINASSVNGNTYPTSAGFTSGGVFYASTTSTVATSAVLTHYGVLYGGGAGQPPVATAADTNVTHALFATATAPALRAIASSDIPTLNQTTTGNAGGLSTFNIPSLGSVASATTTTFSGTGGYIPVSGTTTIVNLTPPSGCSDGSGGTAYACSYIVVSTNGFSVQIGNTGGSTNNITGPEPLGSIVTIPGGSTALFTYDPVNGLWHFVQQVLTSNPVYIHAISGATPTLLVNNLAAAAQDTNYLTLSTNVTSITLPAAGSIADGEMLMLYIQQGASTTYTVASGGALSVLTAGSGTTIVNTVPGGCPAIGTTASSTAPSQLIMTVAYKATLTQYQILGCQTANPTQSSVVEASLSTGWIADGVTGANVVLSGTRTNNAGHITNLQIVYGGSSCTTAPFFNVFVGASLTGSPIQGSNSYQAPGSATNQAQSIAFNAGDNIGVYVGTAGSACTGNYAVTMQYAMP